LSSEKTQAMKLLVYDFTGAQVDIRSFTLKEGTNLFSVKTQNWKDGAYILQFMTDNRVIRKKLIVNRQTLLN
jgi:hypothetical protein